MEKERHKERLLAEIKRLEKAVGEAEDMDEHASLLARLNERYRLRDKFFRVEEPWPKLETKLY